MNDLLGNLRGGDRRSIGQADEVVADVLDDPSLFETLFRGMLDDDPLLSMRAADAVEKITREHPEHLAPYKTTLLQEVARSEQQEVRWHVAQMIPRLQLSQEERSHAVEILVDYLQDRSSIVRTMSMQALADLAAQDRRLPRPVTELLQELVATGSPAMQSRGRKLLRELDSAREDAAEQYPLAN